MKRAMVGGGDAHAAARCSRDAAARGAARIECDDASEFQALIDELDTEHTAPLAIRPGGRMLSESPATTTLVREITMGYYNIDSMHGNELSAGIQLEVVARRIAQETANELNEPVYLYEVGSDEEAEEFTPDLMTTQSTTPKTTTEAIARSVSHDEIVTLDYDAAAYEELLVECDDNVSTEDVTEFWGNDPDDENKMTWRVHMKHAPELEARADHQRARERDE